MNFSVLPLTTELAASLSGECGSWHRDRLTWLRYLAENAAGGRFTLVVLCNDRPVGYGSLKLHSDYKPFARAGIVEVHDLAVSEPWRRRGIATRLIREYETIAQTLGRTRVGLAINLHADSGPAERLYRKLGFSDVLCGAPSAPECRNDRLSAPSIADDGSLLWLTKVLAPAPLLTTSVTTARPAAQTYQGPGGPTKSLCSRNWTV